MDYPGRGAGGEEGDGGERRLALIRPTGYCMEVVKLALDHTPVVPLVTLLDSEGGGGGLC